MYKVFLNERKIVISSKHEITPNLPVKEFHENASAKDVRKWFSGFLKNDEKLNYLVHPRPSRFFQTFRETFKNLPAAGGVVLSNEHILFIFRNEKWDLPKGKAEPGETARITALREVEEECGIKGHKIVKELPATFHIYRSPHQSDNYQWILKETKWFEMNYAGTQKGTPETREGITKIKWFAKDELDEVWVNTYENLKQIISLYRD